MSAAHSEVREGVWIDFSPRQFHLVRPSLAASGIPERVKLVLTPGEAHQVYTRFMETVRSPAKPGPFRTWNAVANKLLAAMRGEGAK